MDFSYEFMMFQRGAHDTTEKLEYYENFIMTLLGELKTLREAIFSCQQQCTPSKTTLSANSISKDSTIATRLLNLRHVIPTLPRMPKMNLFWRTSDPGSSHMPVNISVSSALENPIFYVERDSSVDTKLDVAFVHSFRYISGVCCECFSPDGRYMAVGTVNSSIFIYEVESCIKYCELREYASQYGSYARQAPHNLCFSSDGRYLAVVEGFGRIIIWDVPKKRIRSIFRGSNLAPEIRFSPDGRLVACRTYTGLLVLNIRDKFKRMESEGSSYFDFSPHGRYIATQKNGVFVILDVRTGKAVKAWIGHRGYLRNVKFTSDGRGLLCVYTEMIEQWDLSDVEPVLIRKFEVQTDLLCRPSISPDHRLVVFADELWDVDSGQCQYTLQGHTHRISSVDFSATGTYLAMGCWDGFFSLWKYTQT